MRRFSTFHPFLLSFFSRDLYQDVARNWTGTGFAYLLLLLAVAWLFIAAKIHNDFSGWVEKQGPLLVKDLPKITITNGKVQTDPPGRHEVRDPENGEVFLIIDASMEAIDLDELPEQAVVLTHSKLLVKQKDRSQTRVFDLAGIQDFSMDRADAERWLRALAQWMVPALYPFLVLGSFAYRIVQALFYSLFGMLFRGSAGAQLDFLTVLRLTCVAVTPAVLVDTAKDLSGTPIRLWWLICFLVAIYYVWFAVRAAAEAPAAAADGMQAPPPIAG